MIFECRELNVEARYEGDRRWTVASADGSWSGSNEGVAAAVLAALGLDVEVVLYGVVVSVRAEGGVSGWIKMTFPTDRWIFNIDGPSGGYMAVEVGLKGALKACLDELRLLPARPTAPSRTPLDAARFGLDALTQAAEPRAWADALSAALRANLERADAAEDTFRAMMLELRALGHDIYELDSDGDARIVWRTNWVAKPPGRRVVIELTCPAYEAPQVVVAVSNSERAHGPDGAE